MARRRREWWPAPTNEDVLILRELERFFRYEFRMRPDRDDECDFSALQRDILREVSRGEGGCSVGQLREWFALDKGQLSRLLAQFEAIGWVESSQAAHDARIRIIVPTGMGRWCSANYDAWEDGVAREVLDRLLPDDRGRMLAGGDAFRIMWSRAKGLTIRAR